MTDDEIDSCVGRYGRIRQGSGRSHYWYGQVVELHSSRKFVKFKPGSREAHWCPVADVELHPLQTEGAPEGAPMQPAET